MATLYPLTCPQIQLSELNSHSSKGEIRGEDKMLLLSHVKSCLNISMITRELRERWREGTDLGLQMGRVYPRFILLYIEGLLV